jgi:hypothetical protein
LAAKQPIPQMQVCKALVDTGASHTNIDPTITAALGLTPTGSAPCITPSTGPVPVNCPTYDVGLHVQFPGKQWHSHNPLTVISSALAHQGFTVLLGRDVLARGILIYDGVNKIFTLNF